MAVIALNVLAFLYELQLGRRLDDFLLNWAVIPLRYTDSEIATRFSLLEQALPFFSSMFLHGGWLHLVGNMWILWIFGDNVEDRLGRGKFIGLYLFSGLAASVLHIFTNLNSPLPTIGASGAVAGVMGAYFRFFPHARVQTLVPPFILGPYFELPAILYLGWWFLTQFFSGAMSFGAQQRDFGGVAWWAHVGGFAFGMMVCLFAQRERRRRAYEDRF
jgi:membrane associated rhomboid family serine protease